MIDLESDSGVGVMNTVKGKRESEREKVCEKESESVCERKRDRYGRKRM